ncbi:MAG TPA: GIY-YIG nuclease family protein [Terriglobales bacterium]
MPIMFNTLLIEAGLSLSDVRLLRHVDQRSRKGLTPYELWRDDRAAFDTYQSIQRIESKGAFGGANYWASFAGTEEGETLFLGLYKVEFCGLLDHDVPTPNRDDVDKAGTCHYYNTAGADLLKEYVGKLVIDWGSGTRTWIQRPDRQNKPIVELRRENRDPDFPGFSAFVKPLSRIEGLPRGWKEVLRSSRGIYLFTCPRTREQYVGSASGDNGFLGRWLSYVQSGHGGNEGLKSREPSDYQVSILEVAGSAATTEEIREMESLWKTKLQSREMGLNRN